VQRIGSDQLVAVVAVPLQAVRASSGRNDRRPATMWDFMLFLGKMV